MEADQFPESRLFFPGESARVILLAGAFSIVALAALIVFPRLGFAGGVVGDGTPGSCTEANLDSALAGGGTITFNCGGPKTIALTTVKTIAADTSIDGGALIVLTGTQTARAFFVNPGKALTLDTITLNNFGINNNSGGTIASFGRLTLNKVTIKNSLASGTSGVGGALYLFGSSTSINESSFEGNKGISGGAIQATNSATLNITKTSFANNQTTDPNGVGGAIQLTAGTNMSVTDGTYFGNVSRFGGAINIANGASAVIQGSSADSRIGFIGNRATEDGGALWNAGDVSIKYAEFNANSTPTDTILAGYGGAVTNWLSGTLRFEHGLMSVNKGRFGGALFSGEGVARAYISNVLFSRNSAGSIGGGLYTSGGYTVVMTVTHSLFMNNDAPTGGGLGRFSAYMWLSDSAVISNTATGGAGGFWVASGPTPNEGRVYVSNSTFSGNSAPAGTGGGIDNSGVVDLYYSTIKNNSPIGVRSLAGNVRFRNTVLDNPGGPNCVDPTSTISNDGGNFATDSTCTFLPASVGPDAMLGPLAQTKEDAFYERTYYHPILPGSPLIDKGFGNCPPPPYDQRGAARAAACDVGAIEFAATPVITTLSPSSAIAGSPAVSLTVTGSNFVAGASVEWNGSARPTVYVSPTHVIAAISATDLLTPAVVPVAVRNPGPNDGLSNTLPFTVTAKTEKVFLTASQVTREANF